MILSPGVVVMSFKEKYPVFLMKAMPFVFTKILKPLSLNKKPAYICRATILCLLVSFLILPMFGGYLAAFEMFDSSARQVGLKSAVFSVYTSGGEKDILLSVSNPNTTITINGLTYTSASTTQFDSRLNYGALNAKILFNPGDNAYYWMKLKTGESQFKIPVPGDEDNVFSGGNFYGVGFGLRKQILPATIVTPAFALDMGADFTTSRYSSYRSKNVVWTADSRLNNIELQLGALLTFRAKRRLSFLEPTLGLKVSRIYTTLSDYNTFERIEGIKDTVGITGAVKINLGRGDSDEALVVESEWGAERVISCGMTITLF